MINILIIFLSIIVVILLILIFFHQLSNFFEKIFFRFNVARKVYKIAKDNDYYLLNKDEEKAKEMIQIGLDNDDYLTDEDIGILLSNKYYFKLMNDNYEKVGEEFYKEEKSYRKIAVNYNNYGSIKTALLVSSLVDSSYDLYEHILNVMDKKKNNFSSLRMEKENQLIERALEFIKLKKEDWFKEVDSAE